MKKLFKTISLILTLLLVFAFAGCNTGDTISEEPFYSLQSAYNQGLLKRKDLKKVAEYHNKGSNTIIDKELEDDIKLAYLESYPRNENIELTADEIRINKFYGIYRGCVALMIGYENSGYKDACWEETIAGVKFGYTSSQRIFILKLNI